MTDSRYNNNAITNQKRIKPIANGNAADSSMIPLTDEPLPCWKPKTEWKVKCKSWIKKLINSCFSQIKTKHKLTAYLIYLCYFISYLYKYLNRNWENYLDIFINTSVKVTIFTATQLIWQINISKVVRPSLHYQDMKGPKQIERGKCYSLMLLCLKFNCVNIRIKLAKSQPSAIETTLSLFPAISEGHFLISLIYFRVIIMVGFWFIDTRGLCWEITLSCFASFFRIFRW